MPKGFACVSQKNSYYFRNKHSNSGLRNGKAMSAVRKGLNLKYYLGCGINEFCRDMTQLVARLSQQRSGFDPTPCNVRFVVAKWLSTSTSPRASVFPCQYSSSNAPYSSSATCFSYKKGKGAKPGNLPKKQFSFVNRRALDRKVLPHFKLIDWWFNGTNWISHTILMFV